MGREIADILPNEVYANTSVSVLQNEEGFECAKHNGDGMAANKIIDRHMKFEVLREIWRSHNEALPLYIVPIIASEYEDRLNALPIAYAVTLARELGGAVWPGIIKISGEPNTGQTAIKRYANRQIFAGSQPPSGAEIIIVDDTFTTGQTIVSLRKYLDRNPVAVTTIASGRYGKTLIPKQQVIEAAIKKAKVTRERFIDILGLSPECLTNAQLQQYLLNGASGEDGLINRFGFTDNEKEGEPHEANKWLTEWSKQIMDMAVMAGWESDIAPFEVDEIEIELIDTN